MCKRRLRTLAIVSTMIFVFMPAAARDSLDYRQDARAYIKEVRHELATLPYYGVFDWLEFEVRPDNTVVLRGQVVRPTTKSDAEASVREIEGIAQVVNEIDVLPPSPQDDRLRLALYRAIYGQNSPLFRYATQGRAPDSYPRQSRAGRPERRRRYEERRNSGLRAGAGCAGTFRREE
jgi:hypothetical protein